MKLISIAIVKLYFQFELSSELEFESWSSIQFALSIHSDSVVFICIDTFYAGFNFDPSENL